MSVGQWVDDFLALPSRMKEVLAKMADVSQVLNEVADGLRGPLATSIQALIDERNTLASENAQLKGEDVAESDAAANVKSAFDEVAGKFASTPEVPDVEPLPDQPVDGGGTEGDIQF